MNPKEQALALEKEILTTLGFQMTSHMFHSIANYTIGKIISEYEAVVTYSNETNKSAINAILFWKDVRKEIEKLKR